MPSAPQLQAAADLINAGKKVAILAGRGCLGAREEVLQLADTVAGPIIKPLLGKAVVPDDSPFTTGGIGLLGTAPSQDALKACDTLVKANLNVTIIVIKNNVLGESKWEQLALSGNPQFGV